jgi:hypothetical protein
MPNYSCLLSDDSHCCCHNAQGCQGAPTRSPEAAAWGVLASLRDAAAARTAATASRQHTTVRNTVLFGFD